MEYSTTFEFINESGQYIKITTGEYANAILITKEVVNDKNENRFYLNFDECNKLSELLKIVATRMKENGLE